MWSDRDADSLEMWMKPGQEAFQFWISFFPTAPLFGVEWRFASMADPALNPFLMPGLPGMRAAAMASHPGELDSPAVADEDAAKPVARAAETAGNAAKDLTRIASEAGKAAVRTAGTAMKAGTDAASTVVNAEARALDVAEEAGKTAQKATDTAISAAEDTATTAEIAAEEVAKTAKNTARRGADAATEATSAAAKEATKAAGTAAREQKKAAEDTAEAVDEAIAAAPKPKMLLDKRPKETDDLKGIKGIGPDLERQLNDLGLYRFDQLAKMSDADLAWIDANITRFKGRCFRDDWVGQAKARLAK
jgi:predicted flap endonuclease-1-like 5' DNA nuclease